jgi:hypothetical protein
LAKIVVVFEYLVNRIKTRLEVELAKGLTILKENVLEVVQLFGDDSLGHISDSGGRIRARPPWVGQLSLT